MNSKSIRSIKAIALVLLFTLPTQIFANDDFGWTQSFEAKKEFNKKFDISLEGEMRTYDIAKSIDRLGIGVSASYKLFSFLKIDGGYTYLYTYKPQEIKLKNIDNGFQEYNLEDPFTTNRHRLNLSLTGSMKVGRFVLSLRERFQYTYQEETHTYQTKYRYSDSFGSLVGQDPEKEIVNAKNKAMLRSRLMAKWDIRKCKFEPFASFELSNWVNNGGILDKTRFTLGTDYKISKTSAVELSYLYQRQNDDDEADGHFICVGYSIEF